MKHEYTDGELAELKKIYDESGEAGLDITEMRALRKAGLVTQGMSPEQKPQSEPENPRAIISDALVGIYDSISALQRAAYHANDKVVYMYATKLLNGELMDIKANYSKETK